MKSLIIGVAAILAFAGPAFATGNNNGPHSDADATSNANSTSNANATGVGVGYGGTGVGYGGSAYQSQGQYQQQGQEQRVKQTNQQRVRQSNNQDTSVNVDASTGDTPRMAPSMAISGAISNTTCYAHIGGGVSTPFGGGQLLVPKLDEGCDTRAFAILLIQTGYLDVARALLRQVEKVDNAFKSVEPKVAEAPKRTEPHAAIGVREGAVAEIRVFGQPTRDVNQGQ